MSIANLLKGHTFDADTIVIIAAAFDAACRDLGLTLRRDPITETLAMKIIEAAQTGERDPNALRQQAISILAANPPTNLGSQGDTTAEGAREDRPGPSLGKPRL